ncbi:MAG: hypothetical protein QOJ29_2893 [Thermoleophilaceae bacterium]|nr:hypothetical protein [Thermoleophilaceae bacterium]
MAGWWCDPEAAGLEVLPNPWDDRDAIVLYQAQVARATEQLLEELTPLLNDLNGVSEPLRYWRWLLEPWLLLLVAATADRLLFVRTVHALAPDKPVRHGRGSLRPPTRIREGTDDLVSESWNVQALALLCERAGQSLAPEATGPPPADKSAARRSARVVAGELAQRALAAAPGRRALLLGLLHLSPADVLRLMRAAPGARYGGLPPGHIRAQDAPPRTDARKRLSAVGSGDDLREAVAALLPQTLPVSVIEGYTELVRESRERHGEPGPVVHGNYSFHEIDNEYLARCGAGDAPIAFVQHGGAYFQAAVMDWVELRPDTQFFSWGVQAPGVRPVTSPHLAKLADSHVPGGDEIVVVEDIVTAALFVTRFSSEPMGNQRLELFDRLSRLATAVDEPTRRSLRLKRFPGAGVRRPPAVETLPPPAGRGAVSASAAMRSARVAVVTYPDTPFLEALVIGVPTIGFWDPGRWEMTPVAAALYEQLEAADIVIADPERAAAHLDAIHDDPASWWASAAVQAARGAYLDYFVRRGDWLADWGAALRDLRCAL